MPTYHWVVFAGNRHIKLRVDYNSKLVNIVLPRDYNDFVVTKQPDGDLSARAASVSNPRRQGTR